MVGEDTFRAVEANSLDCVPMRIECAQSDGTAVDYAARRLV